MVSPDERAPRVWASTHFLDLAEMAVRAGVEPQTMRAWRVRGKVPEPDVWIGNRPGWADETITRWLVRVGRGGS